MSKQIARSLLIAAVVLAGLSVHHSAQALSLVPPSLEYSVKPGDVVADQVKLYNEQDQSMTVTPSSANFGAKDETGQPDFTFDAPSADLASWITLDTSPLTIKPSDRATIAFTITVPKNAEPGGHYAGIFFATGAPKEGQVAVQSKIGTLIILSVAGNEKELASIVETGVNNAQKTLSRLPVSFFARIRNTGNVHVRPEGSVTIKNMFGRVSAVIPVNDVRGAVLPKSIRRFEMSWSKGADVCDQEPDGTSKPCGFFQQVGAEWRNFGFGTYTASFDLTYGKTSKALSDSVSFMIIPWRLLLVEFLALVLLVVVFLFGIRRYNRAIIRSAQSRKNIPPVKRM